MQITCELINEDDTVEWLINGKPVTDDEKCTEEVEGFTRILHIAEITPMYNDTIIVAKTGDHVAETNLFVEDTPAEFVERLPRRSFGNVGEDVQLNVIMNHPTDRVKFMFNDETIVEDETYLVTTEGNVCTLTIKNANFDNAGRYSVKVDSSETTTTLVIQGAPMIDDTELPEALEFEVHENIAFKVPFKAQPEPSVQISVNGQPLSVGTKFSVDVVDDNVLFCKRKATKQDAGEYTVKLENEFGEVTKTFSVAVKGTFDMKN